jgi:hypothetical protein
MRRGDRWQKERLMSLSLTRDQLLTPYSSLDDLEWCSRLALLQLDTMGMVVPASAAAEVTKKGKKWLLTHILLPI